MNFLVSLWDYLRFLFTFCCQSARWRNSVRQLSLVTDRQTDRRLTLRTDAGRRSELKWTEWTEAFARIPSKGTRIIVVTVSLFSLFADIRARSHANEEQHWHSLGSIDIDPTKGTEPECFAPSLYHPYLWTLGFLNSYGTSPYSTWSSHATPWSAEQLAAYRKSGGYNCLCAQEVIRIHAQQLLFGEGENKTEG